MTLGINTNVMSINAQRQMKKTIRNQNSNLRKLSSGERITRAGDDAAGLAISENLKAQIRGLKQADRNANDAVSLIQTAEGSLGSISAMVIRLRELAIQAASDTIGDTERGFSDMEFQKLKEEIDRIARSTEFNGTPLLDGTAGVLEFQIGTHNDPVLDRIQYDGAGTDATIEALGLVSESVASKLGAQSSLKVLDDALVRLSGYRSLLGATQNRLTSTSNNLQVFHENISAANSRIRDVDVAAETADLAKNNILLNAGASVITQANQAPNIALKLIG